MNEEVTYETCPNCERNFFKGKLKMHAKLCTPQKPMKFIAKQKQKRSKSIHDPKTNRTQNKHVSLDRSYVASAECQICGRKFNPKNLEQHLEICKKNYQELLYKKMIIDKQLKHKKLKYQCKKCGYELDEDHNFCGKCGTKKEQSNQPQQQIIPSGEQSQNISNIDNS